MIRSTDGGTTWSQPIIDAQQVFAGVSIAGHAVRSSDELPEFAAGPQRQRLRGLAGRALQRERHREGRLLTVDRRRPDLVDADPGRPVAGQHSGIPPQVHVASDGTVGLCYYDLESATAAQPGLTDTFIVHCHRPSDCTNPASWAAGGETKAEHERAVRLLTRRQTPAATSSATTKV